MLKEVYKCLLVMGSLYGNTCQLDQAPEHLQGVEALFLLFLQLGEDLMLGLVDDSKESLHPQTHMASYDLRPLTAHDRRKQSLATLDPSGNTVFSFGQCHITQGQLRLNTDQRVSRQ
ncbi:hypothetical protein Q7C36_005700 [Tachysurus vachellii]|uniref:Uncharacterized protein n=1 Tax=Tachysurus vachellii TaxID=175792 RepID=A0AA88NFD0_TACVA|nr:hypothetical protein Q7C36_005700 [Tachysurus vachellii]